MGSSSKIVLVGATSLIVGTYGISLKQAQTNQIFAAKALFTQVNKEKVMDAAMRAAIDGVAKSNGNLNKYSGKSSTALDGGTFDYSVTKVENGHDATWTLAVTMVRDRVTSTAFANIVKLGGPDKPDQGPRKVHRGKWQVSQVFFQ